MSPNVAHMKFTWVKTDWGVTPPISCLECGTAMVETTSSSLDGVKLYTCPACPPEPEADDQAELAELLKDCKAKLAFYRANAAGEYLGGVEYTKLIRRLDEAVDRLQARTRKVLSLPPWTGSTRPALEHYALTETTR